MVVVGCGGRWWWVVVIGGGWWWVVEVGGPWRPREATEASSRAQILAQCWESSLLPTPPGPLKLRLLGKLKSRKDEFVFSICF